jgi:hypothetical protein
MSRHLVIAPRPVLRQTLEDRARAQALADRRVSACLSMMLRGFERCDRLPLPVAFARAWQEAEALRSDTGGVA